MTREVVDHVPVVRPPTFRYLFRGADRLQSDEAEVGGTPPPERAEPEPPKPVHHPFAGFAAGICSGCVLCSRMLPSSLRPHRWTKLIVGHPFDTIKVCSPVRGYIDRADRSRLEVRWLMYIRGPSADVTVQCAPKGTFGGAWHCFKTTISKEVRCRPAGDRPRNESVVLNNVQGPRALYKGASVPAVSWGITDSILMGRYAT